MILYMSLADESLMTVVNIFFRQTQSLEFPGELQHVSHTSGKPQCTRKLQIRDSDYFNGEVPYWCLIGPELR